MRQARSGAALLAGALLSAPWVGPSDCRAGEADVLSAEVSCDATRVCRFDVTVRHADEGWEHYADAWQVTTPGGEPLGTRKLMHPHVEEQPFTRSLTGVRVPDGVEEVRIRARDSVHAWGGAELRVGIPR